MFKRGLTSDEENKISTEKIQKPDHTQWVTSFSTEHCEARALTPPPPLHIVPVARALLNGTQIQRWRMITFHILDMQTPCFGKHLNTISICQVVKGSIKSFYNTL